MKQVVVIGLGYVGLPSVINHVKKGNQVIGYDTNEWKVGVLNKGQSYLDTVEEEQIKALLAEGVTFTANAHEIIGKDVYIIDVPTPIDQYKRPDLGCVAAAAALVLQVARKGALILLESTTYPGTTEEYLVEPFEKKGFVIGEDLFIGYSPERISPGDKTTQEVQIPRVIAGHTERCLKQMEIFYGEHVHAVSSLQTAELTKLYENSFRLVNIALADELHKISENLEIETAEVIHAAGTKPYGFMKFTPSLGIGGHCIPVDPYYLSWVMERRGVPTPLIQTAGRINESMMAYHIEKIQQKLKQKGLTLRQARIALIGVTYKENVADIRMSAPLKLYETLEKEGAKVTVFDDVLLECLSEEQLPVRSLLTNLQQLQAYDLVLYGVNHQIYACQKAEIEQVSSQFYSMVVV